jgi:hypothetical protein
MLKETITAKERIEAALKCEEVDRTPVGLLPLQGFIYKYLGMNVSSGFQDRLEHPDMEVEDAEIAFQDAVKRSDKMQQMMLDFYHKSGLDFLYGGGSYDMPNPSMPAMPHMTPGIDLPDGEETQVMHQEIMRADDYDRMKAIGVDNFWLELVNRSDKLRDAGRMIGSIHLIDWVRKYPQFRGEKNITWDMVKEAKRLNDILSERSRVFFEKKGVPILTDGGGAEPSGAFLGIWRTFPQFMLDIHRQYDKVKEVILETMMPYWLEMFGEACRVSRTRRVMVAGALVNLPNVSRKVFEEIQWPWFTKCTEMCIKEGVEILFHLDSDWTESLEYFKELPKHKFVLHLDGTTDIFKAKKIMAGHACIMGDLPPAMLCTASTYEVENYCKELIDEVGKGGGFILCNGCGLPASAKVNNINTMVHVAKTYSGKKK